MGLDSKGERIYYPKSRLILYTNQTHNLTNHTTMAFGKGGSFSPGTKIFSFKIRSKDLPAPVFEVSQKGPEGATERTIISKDTTRVSGTLIGIRNKEFEYQGKMIKSVELTLQDKDEIYFVTVGYTYLGRNILNSLLSLKTFIGLEISLYQSKPKPDAKDKRGFPSVAIRQNGEIVYGKFDSRKGELPVIKKVKVGETVYSDDTEINSFFLTQVSELAKIVKAKTPEVDSAVHDAAVAANEGEASASANAGNASNNDDDIPF